METQEVRIPVDRIAVLIGQKGGVKKRIEQRMQVRIHIDSEEGDITLSGDDGLAVYEAANVIKAIGRGFNPKVVELLYSESYTFDLIDITDFSGKSQKAVARLKGRVIGQQGKAWKMIESMTGCVLSVYGKTVGIIGLVEDVQTARRAVEMLLEGAPHGNVYRWLETKQREIGRRSLEQGLGVG